MARAALPRGLSWRAATVVGARTETATARTLVLDVADWPGHDAGQHLDLRLTAPDGYVASRSYSIASAWGGPHVEVTVERFDDGEVSPYLVDVVEVGDQIEVRGPLGGWFVWRPELTEPVQLVAGGSGIVPLMAMMRARALVGASSPCRLLLSVRAPAALLFGEEIAALAQGPAPLRVDHVWTRTAPDGSPRPAGRLTGADVAELTLPASSGPTCYVCGPTAFVEAVADLLLAQGHDPATVRTERFGG